MSGTLAAAPAKVRKLCKGCCVFAALTRSMHILKSREGFGANLVRRGHSNDSQETQDSPFGSSLATPLDPNDVSLRSTSASASSALRFLAAAGDAPFLDYFKFKGNGSPTLSMARDLSSDGKLTPEDIASDYTNAGSSHLCSAIGTPAEDALIRKKVSTYEVHDSALNFGDDRAYTTCLTRLSMYKSVILGAHLQRLLLCSTRWTTHRALLSREIMIYWLSIPRRQKTVLLATTFLSPMKISYGSFVPNTFLLWISQHRLQESSASFLGVSALAERCFYGPINWSRSPSKPDIWILRKAYAGLRTGRT